MDVERSWVIVNKNPARHGPHHAPRAGRGGLPRARRRMLPRAQKGRSSPAWNLLVKTPRPSPHSRAAGIAAQVGSEAFPAAQKRCMTNFLLCVKSLAHTSCQGSDTCFGKKLIFVVSFAHGSAGIPRTRARDLDILVGRYARRQPRCAGRLNRL